MKSHQRPPIVFVMFLSLWFFAWMTSCGSDSDDAVSQENPADDDIDDSAGDDTGDAPNPDISLTADLCLPECKDKECGDDGCGGSCGLCSSDLACDEGTSRCLKEAVAAVVTRDGINLRTKIFLPDSVAEGGTPLLLYRTPYRYAFADAFLEEEARFHTSRGYAYILQDCRGRFGSGGTFEPFRHEREDGADTVEWILAQPWSDGVIGAIGGSYDGFTAISAAIGNSAVSLVVTEEVPQDEGHSLSGGTPALGFLYWRRQLDTGFEPSEDEKIASSNVIDLITLDQTILGRIDEYWNVFLSAETPDDPVWEEMTIRGTYGETCAAMLSVHSSISKWNDPIDAWSGFLNDGCAEHRNDARLVITPEDHVYHIRRISYEETWPNSLMLKYIDRWLLGSAVDLSDVSRVTYISTNSDEYIGADEWPPPSNEIVFYLDNATSDMQSGSLAATPGADGAEALDVDPDTMDPCSDYPTAVYTSEALAEPLYVVGYPKLVVHFASDSAPDLDIFAAIWEKYGGPLGLGTDVGTAVSLRARYRNGYASPTPLAPTEIVEAEMDYFPIVHQFGQGSHIVLTLSPGRCEHAENPNSGEALTEQTGGLPVTLSIHHGAGYPSRIILPVAE